MKSINKTIKTINKELDRIETGLKDMKNKREKEE